NLLAADPSTRKVAVLAADGVDAARVTAVVGTLAERGVLAQVVGPHGGTLQDQAGGAGVVVDVAMPTTASVLYDAVLVPGGDGSVRTLAQDPDARRFIEEAHRHGKPIGVLDSAAELLSAVCGEDLAPDVEGNGVRSRQGLIAADASGGDLDRFHQAFVTALAAHRFPDRGLSRGDIAAG
ncbi:MAG: catalase HPII, partial [Catenulispora sp.]|nr:catalase HPII [Catenulispora sp.]